MINGLDVIGHMYPTAPSYNNAVPPGPPGETAAERRARRRRTRWMGSEHDKTFIPGLPTVLPSTLTREQEEQYLRECLPRSTASRPPSQPSLLHLTSDLFPISPLPRYLTIDKIPPLL